MNKTTLKSIGAVFAGLSTIIVGSTVVDVVLHAAKVYPPMGTPMTDALAVLASSYRPVISIAGVWLTARLAPDRPMHTPSFSAASAWCSGAWGWWRRGTSASGHGGIRSRS